MPFHQNLQCLLVLLAFMIDIGHSESNMFCQPGATWIYFTESDNIGKNITSPGYPASTYSTSSTCDISMGITLPHTAVLQVEHRGVVSAECTTDYQFLDSSLNSLTTYHNCTQLNDGNTSQLIHVLLRNNVNSRFDVFIRLSGLVEGNRFHLNLYVLPLYAMRSKVDNAYYTQSLQSTPTGYISSHSTFNSHYGANLVNYLQFVNISSNAAEVVFEFVYINIGNDGSGSSCNANQFDVLRIYGTKSDDALTQLHEICDTASPLDSLRVNLTQSPATALLLEFLTSSRESFDGFLLKYYVVFQTTTMSTTAAAAAAAATTMITATTKPNKLSTATLKVTTTTPPATSKITKASPKAVATSTIIPNITDGLLSSTEAASPPSFFSNSSNIAAVSATVLILIIIVNVVVCVVNRRRAASKRKRLTEKELTLNEMTAAGDTDVYEQVADNSREVAGEHMYAALDLEQSGDRTANSTRSANANYVNATLDFQGDSSCTYFNFPAEEERGNESNNKLDGKKPSTTEYSEVGSLSVVSQQIRSGNKESANGGDLYTALSEQETSHVYSSLNMETSAAETSAERDMDSQEGFADTYMNV